jgi:SAM-dependent methyltransferase
MKDCRICKAELAYPDYLADSPAMTSLSTMIDVKTEVSVCRACGHVQSPDLPDVQAFYDHDYRISLQSDDHDQLYAMEDDGPVFRTSHQAQLLMEMDVPEGAKLLDFGAAKAVTTHRFLEARPDVQPHVFDVSEDYRSHWDEWIERDAQATYALPDHWAGRFDLITSHFVLEHVADPVLVLKSMKSCLAPDGQLFFTVPDPIGNSGDLLVVDHLNHFVPSSLHHAVQAAGLSIVSSRSNLFRGAHVVVAQHSAEADVEPVQDQTEEVLTLLNEWRYMLDNLRVVLASPDTKISKIAIYGAGFYGALFSPLAEDRTVCFLDRNPHLLGSSMNGKPILVPEACPDVDVVVAALNPARARDILPENAKWLPKDAQVIYPEASKK